MSVTPVLAPDENHLVNIMVTLQANAEAAASGYAKTADRIELTTIILSLVTTGSFWALVADRLPKALGWIGALIGTFTTVLTIYLYWSGVQGKRKKAILLYEDITDYLGELRGRAYLDDQEFWVRYKAFERSLVKLKLEKPD